MWGSTRRTGEILLGLVVQLQAAKDVACNFVLARSGKNLCSSSFFDFRMTSSVLRVLDAMDFTQLGSRRLRVLYLMHMSLINDAVYQEGSMRLINNMHLIARCS